MSLSREQQSGSAASSRSACDYEIRLTIHCFQSHSPAAELERLAASRGRQAGIVSADLRDVSAIRNVVEIAEKRFGPVDVLINSASDFFPTPALEVTEEQWDQLLDLNLKGQFFLAQACGINMVPRGGVIINIADVNGERPMRRHSPFAISKAGLLMMTKNLALEWAPRVRVNSVSPGAVLLPERYTSLQIQRSIERTLLKRLGTPQDVAEAVLFLVHNDYITGFNLRVDGGRSLYPLD